MKVMLFLSMLKYVNIDKRGTKVDAAVRHFENFWQFNDLVQVLLCAD